MLLKRDRVGSFVITGLADRVTMSLKCERVWVHRHHWLCWPGKGFKVVLLKHDIACQELVSCLTSQQHASEP